MPSFPSTPAIFAAGRVSTDAPEFSLAISRDNRTVFFDRSAPDRRSFTIMTSHYDGREWSAAVPMFSDTVRRADPFLSVDGQRLYYSSNALTSPSDNVADFNTWYVPREGVGWGEPHVLESRALNTDSTEIFVSEDRNRTLYFASNRDGVMRIYRSEMKNGMYATSVVVPFTGNGSSTAGAGVSNPGISPDGSMLVFERGGDLALTCLRRGAWSDPVKLDALNSASLDFAPSFSADGRTMYFTSERPGIMPAPAAGVRPPGDIYSVSAAAIRGFCPK